MTGKIPRMTPLQVIYSAFPGAVRYVAGHMNRVRDVSNPIGDRRDQLSARVRQAVARRMTYEQARLDQREHLRQQHLTARRSIQASGGNPAPTTGPEPILPALFDEESSDLAAATVPSTSMGSSPIRPADISLIDVTDDTVVRTRVFPRSAQCQRCGHFLLLDPDRPPTTLSCPCCRVGQLVIEPIIFICGRCAAVRELLPPAERIGTGRGRRRRRPEESLGVAPQCPECKVGHIHLEKHGTNSVSRWEWICASCDQYREIVQEPCGACGIPGAGTEPSDYIFMQAIPAAAANALQPLVAPQMFVGDEEIDLRALQAQAARHSQDWPDAFSLAEAEDRGKISPEQAQRLHDSCLRNAYLVNDVRTFTTVFGCKAGDVASHPLTPTQDIDRLARFFLDPEGLARFLAYCVSTKGSALLLELDPQRTIERLVALDPALAGTSLPEAIAAESIAISHREVRDLLRVEGIDLVAYRALHAIEHALLASAMRQIGNEALGSRLFPAAATIMIFETAAVGRGGVVQLVNRGPGLVRLFEAAQDAMSGCLRGCRDGCPACVYVKDPYCNQPHDQLGKDWLPANSLLSRQGAARILVRVMP